MAAKGAPWENAQAESFVRTLKDEAVYLSEYGTFQEAERKDRAVHNEVYNQNRLHSALGYRARNFLPRLEAVIFTHSSGS